MIPYIAVIDTGYSSYEYEKRLFEEQGFGLKLFNGAPRNYKLKYEFAKDAIGILVRSTPIKRDFLKRADQLKAIVRYGTGYDNVDLEAATEMGIRVANVQNYANHAVSDHAMALMFSCLRDISLAQKYLTKQFGKPPFPEVFELHDKTLGIIGLGRIGTHFAIKAAPLFYRTLATDPYIPDNKFKESGAEKADLLTLLSESHVISIHCTLTEETYHLINPETFRMMKKRPVMINTARGPIIDEKALLYALDHELIHSAGIDVWEEEPVTKRQNALIQHPRLTGTGHIAWYSGYSIREVQKRAADNLLALLKGERIPDCLNPVD
jgi:D-3-phosphoglycerate dehydrogenase